MTRVKMLLVTCILSLCVNLCFVVRDARQRSLDYQGLEMFPYYLAIAYTAYDFEFHKKDHPNAQFQPGRPFVDMAFSAFQASQPLFSKYGYHADGVYYFLWDLEYMDSSDATAYRELSAIKPYLPLQTYIRPNAIQPLLDAMAKEHMKVHNIQNKSAGAGET